MNSKQITIAVDAMGGDDAPLKVLKGVEIFLKNHKNVNITLFGDKEQIESSIEKNKINLFNFEIFHTDQNVSNHDNANTIIRNRKESSISQGLNYIKDIKYNPIII